MGLRPLVSRDHEDQDSVLQFRSDLLWSGDTDMKLAVGIDVHKEMCTGHATFGGITKPKPKQQDLIDRFNEDFKRFPSDVKGMTDLARYLKGHEVHILIENSTKSHDIYWILKGLGLDVIVAHSSDLNNITKSMRKNDDNDAYQLAHYMRRRLIGEIEFHESYIPGRDVWRRGNSADRC